MCGNSLSWFVYVLELGLRKFKSSASASDLNDFHLSSSTQWHAAAYVTVTLVSRDNMVHVRDMFLNKFGH